jgi:hypothetical protein
MRPLVGWANHHMAGETRTVFALVRDGFLTAFHEPVRPGKCQTEYSRLSHRGSK